MSTYFKVRLQCLHYECVCVAVSVCVFVCVTSIRKKENAKIKQRFPPNLGESNGGGYNQDQMTKKQKNKATRKRSARLTFVFQKVSKDGRLCFFYSQFFCFFFIDWFVVGTPRCNIFFTILSGKHSHLFSLYLLRALSILFFHI